MAHELSIRENGIVEMGYAGQVPWHGLGFKLDKGATIEEWLRGAKMDWEIFRATVKYDVVNSDVDIADLTRTLMYEDKNVLYRSDNNSPLSIVSPGYNIVQPYEILEFYRDLVGTAGLELETAGVLFGGRRFWGLANTGRMVELAGRTVKRTVHNPKDYELTTEVDVEIPDAVKGYLLLTSSCDGTLATTAQFTSIRVVCNNTLSIATRDNNTRIRVPHNRVWNPNEVKEQLGFVDAGWTRFSEQIGLLAEKVAPRDQAVEFLIKVFGDSDVPIDQQSPAVAAKCAGIWELYTGKGHGSTMKSADGTWWGVVNAVTETIDHYTNHRSTSGRLNSAWYGAGNTLKSKAFELALEYAEVS